MALITGTALVAIVWQGAVRIVGSKLAKELVKAGAKHLTKKNFKKSYDFFKGNKKIKTSEKNKILEDLNIVTPKVKKPKVSKDSFPPPKKGETTKEYIVRVDKKLLKNLKHLKRKLKNLKLLKQKLKNLKYQNQKLNHQKNYIHRLKSIYNLQVLQIKGLKL